MAELRRLARQLFNDADKDGNGWLSHSELKKAIRSDKRLDAALAKTFSHWKVGNTTIAIPGLISVDRSCLLRWTPTMTAESA